MSLWKMLCSMSVCLGVLPHAIAANTHTIAASNDQPARLLDSQETEFVSQYTKHHYRIQWTVVGEPPSTGYPVLYLLDGDTTFAPTAVAAHALMVNKMMGKNTPMLIVGIGYPNGKWLDLTKRAKDYTPPLRGQGDAVNVNETEFGGADNFLKFIDQELSVFLRQKFTINTQQQAIFGHSYGGLLAAYSLLKYPEQFQYHIISSPSIWWNDKRLLDFAGDYQQVKHKKVRLTLGALEKDKQDAKRQKRDMYGNFQSFVGALRQHRAEVEEDIYPNETHGSVIFRALLDGLTFLQRHWQ